MTGQSINCWRLERVFGPGIDDYAEIHILPNTQGIIGVGRDTSSNHVVCGREGKSVSRKHFNLVRVGGLSEIKDLCWKLEPISVVNGTFINRFKVSHSGQILSDGDLIGVGNNHTESRRLGDGCSFVYRIIGPVNLVNTSMEIGAEVDVMDSDEKEDLIYFGESCSPNTNDYSLVNLYEDLELSDSDTENNYNFEKEISNSFCCDICSKQFSSKNFKTKHIKTVHGSAHYKCTYCNHKSKYKHNIKIHEERVHKSAADLSNVNKKLLMESNMIKPSQLKQKTLFACKLCQKEYLKKGNLIRHMKFIHISDKKKVGKSKSRKNKNKNCKKTCQICQRSMLDLNRHLRDVHGPRDRFCPHCNYSTTCTDRLNKHKRIHTKKGNINRRQEEREDLELLDSNTEKNNNLETEILNIFCCIICDKQFSSMKSMNKHTKRVHVEAHYKCKYCNHKSKYKSNVQVHKERVHKYVTEIGKVNKEFPKKSSTSSPSRIHTKSIYISDEKIEGKSKFNKQKCNICQSSVFDLDRHMYEVHGPRDKFCANCNYSTTSVDRLNKHIRVHTKKTQKVSRQDQREPTLKVLDTSFEVQKSNEESHLEDSDYWGRKLQELIGEKL